VWLRGRSEARDVAPYMVFQIVGAALAAVVVKLLRGGMEVAPMSVDVGRAFLAEVLFTFALAYVVLNVATAKGTAGNSFYGLAIGMTVMSGAFAVGNISGGVFNPAVAVGVTVMGLSDLSSIWIYLAANFLGGAAAALAFKFANPGDK
jgi:aquaporin Z